EPIAVRVYVRPLEITLPTDDFTTTANDPPPPPLPEKAPPPPPPVPPTVWSTMSSRIEAETSVKRWSTPVVKTEEGQPPGPEDHPSTKEGKAREGNVKTITPNYKLGTEKPSHELKLGTSGYLPNEKGDYKVSMRHEDYKLTVIDPKVRSNANMPLHSTTLPDAKREIAGDFPSQHSKRSLIKLEPLEQRRFKSTESRPITTSNYLTESVERHREMEASRLRDYLKAKESDANKPWNKPGWPGPKKTDDESLRELEHIRKSIETLQKKIKRAQSMYDLRERPTPAEFARETPRPPLPSNGRELVEKSEFDPRRRWASTGQLTVETTERNVRRAATQPPKDVSTATWQFSTQSFSPRSVVSVNGARDDILKKERAWPHLARQSTSVADESGRSLHQLQESYDRKVERFASMPMLHATDRTFIRVKDDKPRSIMKRRELETRDQMLHPSADNQIIEQRQYHRTQSNVSNKPAITETVQRFEETRRTEEVERRVQRKERRDRRSRHHSSSRHHGSHGWENGYSSGGMRSSSLQRGAVNGYLPSNETYYRQSTTRRERDHMGSRYEDEQFGRGIAHARYGSLSDSLRRGELKYIPNGEVRESHWVQNGGGRNMHKSYSTRDVFGGGDHSLSSYRRSSQQMSPFIEFPPSLPRRSDRDYRPVSKSRSYADWDDMGRAGFGREVRRYGHDDDMSRLEAEFRDSLLMPLPNGNMHEMDHRTEAIPGGYETFHRDNRANAGRRVGKDGLPVDYNEATQEYSYKREQELDRRR
uniref:CAP n=1 Tax=Haemonchus contortus TaxID=6289 RepID=A0A7I4YDU6_HAECO